MKYLKKIFSFITIVLCFSLCVGVISNAEAAINYKAKKFDCAVKGLNIVSGEDLRINSKGKVQLNMHINHTSANVVIGANEKKKIAKAKAGKVGYSESGDVVLYGNKAYEVREKRVIVKTKKGKDIRYRKVLVVRTKTGKIIKTIKLDVSKFLKKKNHSVNYSIAEIKEKNKALLYYCHYNYNGTKNYGGLVEVNIKTGKMKKIVSSDKFFLEGYDGKYVYGRIFEPSGVRVIPKKATFFRISLKTKKTKKIVINALEYDDEKFPYQKPIYSFYNGKIMGIEPTGKVFFGTFDSGEFKQVGDISGCTKFQKYTVCDFAMKNKNEFYILYCSNINKGEEPLELEGGLFIVKYQKK